MEKNIIERYNWWKEEILKKKIIYDEKMLSQCVKNLNNGKIKYKDLITKETNYLPEDCRMLERLYHIAYDLKEPVKCEYCGINNVKFISFFQGYLKFCSNKCGRLSDESQKKYKETNLKKHGVEHWSQTKEGKKKLSNKQKEILSDEKRKNDIITKRKNTYKDKTGYDHQMQNPEIVKQIKEKFDELYGGYPLQNPSIMKNMINTNLKKYGVKYTLQNKDVREKGKLKCIENFGKEHWSQTKEGKEKLRKIGIERNELDRKTVLELNNIILLDSEYYHSHYQHNWFCLTCSNKFSTNYNLIQQGYKCPVCYPRTSGTSICEKEIDDFIRNTLNLKTEVNKKNIIYPLELDIYIPDQNIAIEYNGLYWHSDLNNTPKDYHLNKTNLCKEKGIRLIHIFEDEWVLKQNIVKERLKQILKCNNNQKIYARKCYIKEINSNIKNEFLLKYHLQGTDFSSIRLGAFYNDELISVMTFSKGNISKGSKNIKNVWELSRFATNHDYHVIGIASKLLTYFKRNYEWKEIFTFADKRWSEGDLYYKLKFNYLYDTKPNYWYIKNIKRIHRFNLRKKKEEPKNITEFELRKSEGYNRIWDCGNMKFSITNEKCNVEKNKASPL